MQKKEIEKIYIKKINELKKHNKAYFQNDNPLISDKKYDDIKEEVTGLCEVRETFKISRLGTIAGCMVTKGYILRNSEVRLIREGVVIFTGSLSSLKRFKEDVKEVKKGYDCGLQINDYKDIKVGDEIEAFINVEVKKKL